MLTQRHAICRGDAAEAAKVEWRTRAARRVSHYARYAARRRDRVSHRHNMLGLISLFYEFLLFSAACARPLRRFVSFRSRLTIVGLWPHSSAAIAMSATPITRLLLQLMMPRPPTPDAQPPRAAQLTASRDQSVSRPTNERAAVEFCAPPDQPARASSRHRQPPSPSAAYACESDSRGPPPEAWR